MKNIHVLPKDIFNQLGVDHYGKTPTQIKIGEFLINKDIYITSDEEIKEGDYCVDGKLVGYYSFDEAGCPIIKSSKHTRVYNFGLAPHAKKITLTTDQDLIKDGVQSIPDEFLEWFCKNPTCEEVEVARPNKCKVIGCDLECILFKTCENIYIGYEIIIPKEEQTLLVSNNEDIIPDYSQPKSYLESRLEELDKEEHKQIIESVSIGEETVHVITYEPLYEEPKQELERGVTITHVGKQETLEEVIERLFRHYPESSGYRKAAIIGKEWQQERSYSEEDMQEAFNKGFYTAYGCKSEWIERIEIFFKEWFEQYRKK